MGMCAIHSNKFLFLCMYGNGCYLYFGEIYTFVLFFSDCYTKILILIYSSF